MQRKTVTKILVNGISAKSGGGRSILTNFLKIAHDADDDFRYIVTVSSLEGYKDLACEKIQFVSMGRQSHTMMIPFASVVTLPRLIRRYDCDLVFNLSDIPIRTKSPQVFLFDWPYAAFPESPAWRLSTLRDRLVRHSKLFLFRQLLSFVDVMIAQNKVLAELLRKNYGLEGIKVVPNAVSVDNLSGGAGHDFGLGDGFKYLCLSRYYSHKNIEIFLPLAELIKANGLTTKIVTTISSQDGAGAAAFLLAVKDRKLEDVIVNLGPVSMEWVPDLYQQTDALLLPTLLESFSGTYVEAMYHHKPIFTSRLPFAEGVCGTAAFYFDPLDADAIYSCMRAAIKSPERIESKVLAAAKLLQEMPTWDDAYNAYAMAFKTALQDTE